MRELYDVLHSERLTAVVDIGAALGDTPPYMLMLIDQRCTLVGFEPNPPDLANLRNQARPGETYLPDFVYDGKPAVFRVCDHAGMSSLLEPDPRVFHPVWSEFPTVLERRDVQTRRLDDIHEITHMDMLKIDVQGAEKVIFENGREKLREAVCVQVEASFIPIYQGQFTFGETDSALRARGFVPHMFGKFIPVALSPLVVDPDRYSEMHQVLELDIVYVKDFLHFGRLSLEQVRQLALIAHYCYGSRGLALRCLVELEARGEPRLVQAWLGK